MSNQAIDRFRLESNFGTDMYNPDHVLLMDAIARSYCNDPIPVPTRHHYRNLSATLYAPCGKCEQCRNTAANDLTCRFYQDARKLGHAYFVTLTYPSFRYANDIPPALYSLYWHFDADNFNEKPLFSPCLLDYSHIQLYHKLLRKRLRKTYGKNVILETLCTGELGHRHGRPHWHLLYISDQVITKDIITQSWIDTIKTEARVDYENLITNGTLEAREDLRNPTKGNRNTKKCVKYIVKYATKDSYKTSNTKRLKLSLRFLLSEDPYISTPTDLCCLSPYQQQRINTYVNENNSLEQDQTLQPSKQTQKYYNREDLKLPDIYSLFGTAKHSSTFHAIGKIYALANCSRFASGNRKLPPVPTRTGTLHLDQKYNSKSLQPDTLQATFPQYFSKVTQRYQLPLYKSLQTLKGHLQPAPFTLHDYNALSALWSRYSYLFYRGTRNNPPIATYRPLQYEDLEPMGLHLTDPELYTLFPDFSGKSLTRFSLGNRHCLQVYFRFRTSRVYLAQVTDIYGGIYPAILTERYDKHTRQWTTPRLCSPSFFYNAGLLPLMAFQKEYNEIWNNATRQAEVITAIKDSPQFYEAIQRNREDWDFFKYNKDLQTSIKNAYD